MHRFSRPSVRWWNSSTGNSLSRVAARPCARCLRDPAVTAPSVRLDPFFLPVGSEQRFCVHVGPADGGATHGVVFVHPFAEEMNKSRRMASLAARALAAAGVSVLMIDLRGCGDSPGDFADANWDAWLDDVAAAEAWLRERVPRVSLWGLRVGALLAAQRAAAGAGAFAGLLLWQPVTSGDQALTAFLRLQVAGDMLGSSGTRVTVADLRKRLADGETLEIAGYRIAPSLAQGMSVASLAKCRPAVDSVQWLEVVTGEGRGVSPASRTVLAGWEAAGLPVAVSCVQGAPFWASVETTESAPFVQATVEVMERICHPATPNGR